MFKSGLLYTHFSVITMRQRKRKIESPLKDEETQFLNSIFIVFIFFIYTQLQ